MSTAILSSQSCHTLTDWLCYIEQSHPIHRIELGLERVRQVATKGSLQQLPGKKVLIAGTNGKGTTARCIEQILLAQGATVGVYSSPHLLAFNERLRINGLDVSDDAWVSAFHYVEQLRHDIALTYFEFTTLVAFYLLRQAGVDYCIIEVGLGGRLDATNIIEPDVSVITTIDLDHQDWLGNDRDIIGKEKAGVFRQSGLAVIGELDVPATVSAHAAQLGCNLSQVNKHFYYQQQQAVWHWQSGSAQYKNLPVPSIPVQNVACSLAVLQQLQRLPEYEQLSTVLTTLSLTGRMQWLQQQPAIIIDVAHNPQSARYLAEQLKKLQPAYKRIIGFTGMLKDKDISQTLLPLVPVITDWHCVSLDGPRGATAKQVADTLPENCKVQQHGNVEHAFWQLQQQQQSEDLLVVFGSFVTVSAVLSAFEEAK